MSIQFTLRKYIFLASLLMCWFGANAATITSTASGGDWSAGTTWVGGVAPLSTDDVVIVDGATVKLTADTDVHNFTINDGGIFDYDGWVLTIGVGGTVTPTFVSKESGDWDGATTWLGTTATPTSTDDVIICRDHTITGSGTITVATLFINSGGTYVDSNDNLVITSNLVLHGERQGTGSTELQDGAILEGTGNHYSTGNFEIAADATVTIAAGTDIFLVNSIDLASDAIVNNNGKIRALDVTGTASEKWVNGADSWLTTLNSFAVTLDASADGNTVAFTGEANNETINLSVSGIYHHLIIGGAQIKDMPAALTINGNLLIYSNFDTNGYDLIIKGNWTNSGTFIPGNENVTFDGGFDQSITNTTSETFYNLTVDKSDGVLTMNDDVVVTNTLTMTSGDISTGINVLTLGDAITNVGTLSPPAPGGSIIGSFERWIAGTNGESPLFPVGTTTLPLLAQPTFATNTGGSVIVSFVEANPGNEGLSLDDNGTTVYNTFVEGYWDFTVVNGFVPGNFDLDLTATGMTSFAVEAATRLLKRTNTQTDWVVEGAHVNAVGDIVKRSGLSSLSAQYALADNTDCPAPVTYAITGNQDVVTGQANVAYSVVVTTGNTYYWSVTGGTIDAPASGININSITVDWGSTGQVGEVSVYETNTCTQSEEVSLPVNIHTLPTSDISGSVSVTENQADVAYAVESNAGYTYTWTIDGGVQTSGGTTNSIVVDWGEANVGSVSVVASYPGATDAAAVTLEVDIYANILSVQTGNWVDPATWDCNCEPSDYQSVSIESGHRVTLTLNNKTIQNITVAGGAVLDQAAKYLTVQGNLILNGVITGTGAGLTFSGGSGLTIDGTGSINSTGTSLNITGEANISSSADFLFLGDIVITTKIIVTNFGNVELNGDLVGGNGSIWLNGSNSYLTTQGSLFSSNGDLIATATGNTVEYATTTGDGIIAAPLQGKYYNLVLSGSIDKSTSGDITVLGDFTINSGVVNLGTNLHNLTLEGNWVNKGNFTSGSQTVTFSGSNNQSIYNLYGEETYYDMVISKSSGTLSLQNDVAVTNELSMVRGYVNTDISKITLGTSDVNVGTLSYTDGSIIGEFERWIDGTIGTIHFPVGTSEHLREIYFTTDGNQSAGTVIAKFVETNPGTNGLTLSESSVTIYNTFNEGYWDMSEANGFNITGADTYDLELTGKGFSSFSMTTDTRLLFRDDAASDWEFDGTHVAADVTNLIAKRTGMGIFPGQYAFGSDDNCTPPTAPTFSGATDVCKGDNGEVYTITSSTTGITDYTWTVSGGSIAAGQGTGSVTINWENEAQVGSVGLSVTNSCTVSDETLVDVDVHTMAPTSITGSLIVPASTTGYIYSVEDTPDYTYAWTINGGTITTAPSSKTITVDWGTTGIGQIGVTAENLVLGCPVTEVVSIDVYKYVVIKSNVVAGDWDVAASWDCNCIPVAGDNPMILNGHTITMDANVTVEHMNVNIGGSLIANSNGDIDLVITGNLVVDGDISVTSSGKMLNMQLTEGAGFDVGGIGTINPSSSGKTGVLEISRGSCIITSTTLLTINDVDMTIDPSYISVDNYGSITLSQDLISTNANFTWINQTNSMLKIEGELLAVASLNTSAVGNTVYYSDSTGTQNIKVPTVKYHNLTIGGLGTKSLLANTVAEGNLTITDAGILDVSATPFSLSVAENWTNSSSDGDAFVERTGTVTLNGSTAQTITGAETFYGLTLNNSLAGDAITLAGDITITNSFTLTDGQIVSDVTNSIILDAGTDATVAVSAPTADSFVDGPLINVVSSSSVQTVVFPIGKGGEQHLAELTVTHDAADSTAYTTEFIGSAPGSYTLPSSGELIDHVSTIGYWNIDKGAGANVNTNAAMVKLYYLASDAVDVEAELRIVKDDGGGAWINLGGSGSAAPAGDITSIGFDTFSEFALASISLNNPLPVTLLDFYAVTEDVKVMLYWSTASELNNDFFTLEKSNNGSDYVKLGEVAGNGTTNLQMDYSFTDHSPYLGLSYYRLSQTDFDGTTEIFPVVSVLFEGNKGFGVYPNPVSDSYMKLIISKMGNHELLELNIIDLQGKLVENIQLKTDNFGNLESEIHLQNPLQKGAYIFELISPNNKDYVKVLAI